jgi:uncharacterized short protein YbdD (DUF466 family)
MSYENPETAIDTQSGQHWRNLQQTITAAGQGATNAIVAREKEKRDEEKQRKKEDDKKLQKDTDEKKAMLLNGVGKYDDNVSVMKQKSPGVDMSGLYDGGNYYADLNSKVNDPDTNPFQLKQGMVKAGNVIDQFKGFSGWAAAEYDNFITMNSKGIGNQGGIASANKKDRLAQAINVLTKTPSYGTKFKPNDGTPSVAITFNKNSYLMPDGSVPPEIDLFTFGDMLKEDGSFIRGVPIVDGLINNSLNNQTLSSVLGMEKDDQGNIKFNGKILSSKYVKKVPMPVKSVKGANNAVMGVTNYEMQIDRLELAKDPAVEAHISTVAAGILGESKWGGTDLYIDQLIPAWNASHPDAKDKIKEPTEEEKWVRVKDEEFIKLFTPFYLNHIQNYPAKDETGELEQTISVITGGDSSGGAKKGGKTNTREEQRAENIDIANGTTTGEIIHPSDRKRKFVLNDEGRWILYVNEALPGMSGDNWQTNMTKGETLEGLRKKYSNYFINPAAKKPKLNVKKQ